MAVEGCSSTSRTRRLEALLTDRSANPLRLLHVGPLEGSRQDGHYAAELAVSYQASETYEYDMDGRTRRALRGSRRLITKITYVSPTSGIFHSFVVRPVWEQSL